MGYYVTISEADFTIPADKMDDAFEALKALNKRDDLKTGGSYSGGKQTARRFAWMPENYDETCQSAQEVFEQLGFQTRVDEEGNLTLTDYDNKTGAEEHFLRAVAPFVKHGSYITWTGEDGSAWRNVVIAGDLVEQAPSWIAPKGWPTCAPVETLDA